MGHFTGRVEEVRFGAVGDHEVLVACPEGAAPAAGQYTLALEIENQEAILRTPLFLIEETRRGLWASAPVQHNWGPGTRLDLVGPLGHGFNLPGNIQRLGLVAMGATVSRLIPLIRAAAIQAGMTLFTDLPIPYLPAAVEVYPLASLKEALDWPDFMALDVPLERLPDIRKVLGLANGAWLTCPAQVLLTAAMPCAGLAQCGACAIQGRRGWKLACEDGPVFDLNALRW